MSEVASDPRVGALHARVHELDALDVEQHAEVLDEVHRGLQRVLAELDER